MVVDWRCLRYAPGHQRSDVAVGPIADERPLHTTRWFIGMARAPGNLIGNCVATVVVAAWEGDLDRAKARRVLDGEELADVTAGVDRRSSIARPPAQSLLRRRT